MGWRDLLQQEDEDLVLPWLGGRSLAVGSRAFRLEGKMPEEPGWYRFRPSGRRVSLLEAAEPEPDKLTFVRRGFLVGDRFLDEDTPSAGRPELTVSKAERIYLVPPEVERFARVSAGRMAEKEPLVFKEEEMPLGPETAVADALIDDLDSVDHVLDVPPALDAAFRLERWRREEAERQREARRIEAERKAAREELQRLHGDGAGRRAVAAFDFEQAARAALGVGGAHYLEHRPSPQAGEMVVRYRLDGARYECTCDAWTLRIIDAGICLIDHETDERGDTYFTLESLPGVVRQAREEGLLVVFRHLD